MPLFRTVRTLFSKTKKAKSKSTSKSISRSFSPNTKKKIASFTRKRDTKRVFKTIKRDQETKKKIASFTRKRDTKRVFKTIKRDQETKKKIASFTRKRDTKRGFKIIKRLKEDNDCPICLGQIKPNQPGTSAQCEHRFHSACLDEWLSRNNNCPVCREPIFTDTTRHELELQRLRLIIDDRSEALDRLGYNDDLNEEQQAEHNIIYGEFARAILDYDRYALMHELPLYGEVDEEEDEEEEEDEDEDEVWAALMARARMYLADDDDPYVA